MGEYLRVVLLLEEPSLRFSVVFDLDLCELWDLYHRNVLSVSQRDEGRLTQP